MSTPAHDSHQWRKSSRSGEGSSCVEVAFCTCCQIAVRDSKDPNGPRLAFDERSGSTFIDQARRGTFDLH